MLESFSSPEPRIDPRLWETLCRKFRAALLNSQTLNRNFDMFSCLFNFKMVKLSSIGDVTSVPSADRREKSAKFSRPLNYIKYSDEERKGGGGNNWRLQNVVSVFYSINTAFCTRD